MTTNTAARPHETLSAHCASCRRGVALECEGLPGFWGYRTYNEYLCPYCGKQNHQLSPGAIVSARASFDA